LQGSASSPLPRVFDEPVLYAWFEPSTNLFMTVSQNSRRSLRYDPAAHTFHTEPALVKHRYVNNQSVRASPIAPDLGGGARVMAVQDADDITVRWYGDDAERELLATVKVVQVYAVDAAGEAFALSREQAQKYPLHAGDLDVLTVFDHTGTPVGTIPRRPALAIVPDRNGDRVAQLGSGVDVDDRRAGKLLWHVDVEIGGNIYEPVWLEDGGLIAASTTGLTRVDRDGAVIARRCSWNFARTVRPHHLPPIGESMCEAVERGAKPSSRLRPPLRDRTDAFRK
jgi:hypothetical protein